MSFSEFVEGLLLDAIKLKLERVGMAKHSSSPEATGKPKRVLFVCTANIDRSPTAESLLKGVKGFEVKSAGIWFNAPQRLSEDLIDWADIIFTMEERHKMAILALKPNVENKVIVLHIPDIYRRGDLELIGILRAKLSEHLKIEWEC